MYEDLIVVDDDEPQAGPSNTNSSADAMSPPPPPPPATAAAASSAPRTSSRLRASSHNQPQNAPPTVKIVQPAERSTRSGPNRGKFAPKLKLKLSDKLAAQAPGMSFLGQYDRELDSDDEDLVFEEQFILRIPPGEDCERLRKAVASREVPPDVWFKFKDSRRGVFHIGNNTYASKLVDMPCIIESQKTLDNQANVLLTSFYARSWKIAFENEDVVTREKINIDDYIWPHGITPPLAHVRKRRKILENVNPDLSDSEFIEREEPIDAPTPAISDLGDPSTPGILGDEGEDEGDEDGEDGEQDGDIDEELAAELDLALGDDDEDDEEDEEDSDDEEDEDDDDEESQARKLLNEEIRDLEAAVAKKGNEIASSANPLIRKRFEDALRKLTSDLEMKLAQREELQELQRMQKEGISADRESDSDGDADVTVAVGAVASTSAGAGGEEEDLFGDEDAGGPMAID
ncbi:hypothetical protein BT96DRAFT_919232 [Gymnopus androsaceus JB14]|uniref:TAFII55 protein conserved region domain-containing protein n=1 Tax=Gymnopus androsaceus JB14 TaxID=1447944 RepID=A0A6A4HP43_9AGAR|nr:hypothetical protein BT96DRAFT_919232 [Gymnopus androsaceus JB14]